MRIEIHLEMINTNMNNANHVNSSVNKYKCSISKKKALTLVHWNCNSLYNKVEEFKLFCKTLNPCIISLNETKMSEFRADYMIDIENYTSVHKARHYDKNGGGGVALIISNNVKFYESRIFDSLNIEICAIICSFEGKDICIVSYYNPPSEQIQSKIFDILRTNKLDFIIMGDLNARSTLWGAEENNYNGDILDNIILDHDCLIVNNKEPTHVNFSSGNTSILDYCIVSTRLYDKFDKFEVLHNDDMTSDHLPCLISFRSNSNIQHKPTNYNNSTRKRFNFEKADWDCFKKLLPAELPAEYASNLDQVNIFISNSIIFAADNSIPVFRNSSKKSLPKYLLELIKARKKARSMIKKDRLNPSAKAIYNKLTEVIREEVKAIKDTEWREFVKKLGSNPPSTKPFWKRINKIKGKKSNQQIPTMKFGDQLYETDESKAKLFGGILRNTFDLSEDNKFDVRFKEKVEKTINEFDFKNHSNRNLETFSMRELNLVIKSLKKNSASGQDNIHNLMLIHSSQEFRQIILNLINKTVNLSSIPQLWKNSTITMIPKKQNNSNNPKDYRPISLTSCLAKLSERLMLMKIKEFMTKNKITIKQQSGFRQKRQTKDNIFFLTQKAVESLNRGKKMCTVFFDIASAFDKVWHDGLIYKLINLKFPKYIICWIHNFLANRHFEIRMNNF